MKITIDGPSASGKSSLAKEISKRLGIPYLETGLVYRAFAYISIKLGIPPERYEELFKRELQVIPLVGETLLRVEGREIPPEELRTEEVGKRASELGAIPGFREKINLFFRKLIGNSQIIVEGRDAGTHILPSADVKIFITASPEERARRRYEELKRLGKEVPYEEILRKITERDKRDMERPKYPFRPAPDAHIIDTTHMSRDEVLERVLELIRSKHTLTP
ncbi:MAG: (d)CMP kinase [Aquificae bacterium]|nr:(d)CMP kinase [Aquificota bacterium]